MGGEFPHRSTSALRVCELIENHRNYRPQLVDFVALKFAQIGFKSIFSQTLSPRNSALSSYDSVRFHQRPLRNRQAELLGCFQIDHNLKLYRPLDWNVCGLRTF